MQKLIIIGAGGFASEIIWTAKRINQLNQSFELLGLCDDAPQDFEAFNDLPLLGTIEQAVKQIGSTEIGYHIAIGSNQARMTISQRCKYIGWYPVSLLDPSAHIASSAIIGNGTYVGAGSVICPNARIGEGVIVNLHCSIGHDSSIDDFSQLCPGVRVSGFVDVSTGVFMGSNAVVAPGIKVGAWSMLGAGSVGLKNIPSHSKFGGVPARNLSSKPTDK